MQMPAIMGQFFDWIAKTLTKCGFECSGSDLQELVQFWKQDPTAAAGGGGAGKTEEKSEAKTETKVDAGAEVKTEVKADAGASGGGGGLDGAKAKMKGQFPKASVPPKLSAGNGSGPKPTSGP
jgi:hypothetical protein